MPVRPRKPVMRHSSQPAASYIAPSDRRSCGNPAASRSLGSTFQGFRHAGQSRRTRRWAIRASMDDATRNGSMPMSTRRVTAPDASFVCSVLKTRWPVRAARIAISAVSLSRTSPTMITSGSWRRMCRRPTANVRPISGRTWIWLIPAISYSMGSSIVRMRLSIELIVCSHAYSEVDLPEPVGPVTSRMPWGL